jgi:hypothetical protein
LGARISNQTKIQNLNAGLRQPAAPQSIWVLQVGAGMSPSVLQDGKSPWQRFEFSCVAKLFRVLEVGQFLLQHPLVEVNRKILKRVWGKKRK